MEKNVTVLKIWFIVLTFIGILVMDDWLIPNTE